MNKRRFALVFACVVITAGAWGGLTGYIFDSLILIIPVASIGGMVIGFIGARIYLAK